MAGNNNSFGDFANPSNQVQNAFYGQGNSDAAFKAREIADQLTADFKANKIDQPTYLAYMDKLRKSVDNLSQSQRDWQTTQVANAGTLGENSLASNLVANATNRQQFQQQQADQLASNIANNPLAQYNADSNQKRLMAMENQKNLAQNVRDQLTQLGNARDTNAKLVMAASSGGGLPGGTTTFR